MLEDRVAVVTGAGRGIGRTIAEALHAQGAHVVLAARTESEISAVAGQLTSGGRALAVPTDVTDPEQVKSLCKKTVEELGRVDVLVNNAGSSYIASVIQSQDDRWREVIETNLLSCYQCSKTFVRAMIRNKWGRIINISSIAGKTGGALLSAYSASKAGMQALTRSLALEVAPMGITVNAICPGYVATELASYTMGARGKMFGMSAEEYLKKLEQEIPRKKLIEPTEVAALAVFLASPAASGITGQAINVDGGMVP